MLNEEIIGEVIDEMPEDFTLKSFFQKNREEIISIVMQEYITETKIESARMKEYVQGYMDGYGKEKEEALVSMVKKQMKKGKSFVEACNYLFLNEEQRNICKSYMDEHAESSQ